MSVSCNCNAALGEYLKDPYSKPAVFQRGRTTNTQLYSLYRPKKSPSPAPEEIQPEETKPAKKTPAKPRKAPAKGTNGAKAKPGPKSAKAKPGPKSAKAKPGPKRPRPNLKSYSSKPWVHVPRTPNTTMTFDPS